MFKDCINDFSTVSLVSDFMKQNATGLPELSLSSTGIAFMI